MSESSNDPQKKEDGQLARLLQPLAGDAAVVSQQRIDRALEAAGEQFARAGDETEQVQTVAHQTGKSKMIAKVVLGFASLAACLALILIGGNDDASGVTFASILDQLADAETLQLQVRNGDEEAEVWVHFPGSVRWQQTPDRYKIARGSQLWQVDEAQNLAAKTRSPWFRDDQTQVDLLALLGMGAESSEAFRRLEPADSVIQDGKPCHVYRLLTKVDDQAMVIEAWAEVDGGVLRSIAAWPGNQRQGRPAAELRLIATRVAVDEAKFVVADTLTEDGRIGKVVDAQGIVTLRPMMGDRWTPISPQMLVKPGDWLRSDVRGANALTMELLSGYQVIVGPGSLIEWEDTAAMRLHGGEVKVIGAKSAKGNLKILGPDDQLVALAAGETAHYRIDRESKLVRVEKTPKWLAGFEGTSAVQSVGSLICNIDGRNVPLTVGFHKVKVEIRDQIARTTIEESFVNHTRNVLEGTFHFPLPQDASISGFGMWINGELIEADVVEKQRAREIYEEILRARRDPGLLEWSGGNIFKARVFPIPAHGEKRIQIVYTQVLPMRANRYRYSYGLRSEMLRKTPLRELSLDVSVHSAMPLKSVECATHPVRDQQTRHSARLEFTAQEYTPERDFEVVCEVDSAQSDVVVVPHRRGDDGYFLVQLTPPTPDGHWQREILPDGEPVELLLVCDTSASMDSEKRKQQQGFVASVLSALGPKDRFNLAVADVDCQWLLDEAVAATTDEVAKAVQWLGQRQSLGWTDLDRMAESVLDQSTDPSHVVYVGDGIVTARDADPQSFANRLKRLAGESRGGTFHAVSVGNSFETTVLHAIASLGGGSVRQISGEQTPSRVAFELLNEIAQPGLRDLKVQFRGLQVAAVYPKRLPNLAAGAQQILMGRFLPTGENQSGEIVIRGQRGGREVTYKTKIELADAESGNSFIPRLWARAHLDHLLQQGKSQQIRDEIIRLSETFHIITPYTSLLVLETDEDRERYGVRRRYQMRDGERFFADGADQAKYELLQQQMKRAGDWRIGLRRQILAELARLGRDPELYREHLQKATNMPTSSPFAVNGVTEIYSGGMFWGGGGIGGGMGGFGGGGGAMGGGVFPVSDRIGFDTTISAFLDSDREKLQAIDGLESLEKAAQAMDGFDSLAGEADFQPALRANVMSRLPARMDLNNRRKQSISRQVRPFFGERASSRGWFEGGLSRLAQQPIGGMMGYGGYYQDPNRSIRWVDSLFPSVPTVSEPLDLPKSDWPAEVLAISESLLQRMAVPEGGIVVDRDTEHRDARWNHATGKSHRVELFSADHWLSYVESSGSDTQVQWCDLEVRGSYSRAFQLGRTRKMVAADRSTFHPGHRPHADTPLHVSHRDFDPAILRARDGQVVLSLTLPGSQPVRSTELVIDTVRNIVVRSDSRSDGKLVSSIRYEDHIKLAGVWWPRAIRTLDADNRTISETKQTVSELSDDDFADRYKSELPDPGTRQLIAMPLPSVRSSEVAAAEGSASIEHRLTLLLRACLVQQWGEVMRQLSHWENLSPGKPGLAWIRAAVLIAARKNEEARQLLIQQSDAVLAAPSLTDFFLANYILGQLGSISDHNEQLEVLHQLKPVFDRQPAIAEAQRAWKIRQTSHWRSLQRQSEAEKQQKELASSAPWDVSSQTTYAYDLKNGGDTDAAIEWLKAQIDRPEHSDASLQSLRSTVSQILTEQGRAEQLVEFLEPWLEDVPVGQNLYGQYTHALWLANRGDEADDLAMKWLVAGRIQGELDTAALERLSAAIDYALGQRQPMYRSWIDLKWFDPLAETAKFFLDHPHHRALANTIVDSYRFTNSPASDQLRAFIARQLVEQADTLKPSDVMDYVRWTIAKKDLTANQWNEIAATLRGRWDDEQETKPRDLLATALMQIYSVKSRDGEHLPFMRARIARESRQPDSGARVAGLKLALMDELISRPWQLAHETETLDLLAETTAAEQSSVALMNRVSNLHRLVDAMLQARYKQSVNALQDTGHTEDLTRTQLAKKLAEYQKLAREGLESSLAKYLGSIKGRDLEPWVQMERSYLDLRLDRKHKQVARRCWAILGETPQPKPDRNDAVDADSIEAGRMARTQQLLEERAFASLHYLAVRRSAPEDLTDRLIAYVKQGESFPGDASAIWKERMFSLLVALDRVDDLERSLRRWIRTDAFPVDWQVSLGQLLAERGKIGEAIALLETVERDSRLSPADYQSLAHWYLVDDRREKFNQARIAVFRSMREYEIQNWIQQQSQPWYRTDVPLPTELNEDVLFAFEALFQKSNRPQDYASTLSRFYAACRDFRLLRMIPHSLVGRTPQQVYPYLKSLQASCLNEIRKESTADELLLRLREVRGEATSAIDRRALDLLESMIERRASDVLDQPGPHIDAAVAALQRAFEREWADGEMRQMANYLSAMGRLAHQKLADERLRQLKELHRMTEPGSDDRFFTAWYLAEALFGSGNDRAAGLAIMENAVAEIEPSYVEGWPVHLKDPLSGYVGLLESERRYAEGEQVLTKCLMLRQQHWLLQRRNRLYLNAFVRGGRVSLGEGDDLFTNLETHLLKQTDTADDEHRKEVVWVLLDVYSRAKDKRMDYGKRLREFGFRRVPEILERQTNSYREIVDRVGQRIKELLGPRDALEFLIVAFEGYPERFQYNWEAPFRQHGYLLNVWHKDSFGQAKELEPRLLKIVLAELRRDLETRESSTRYFYHDNYGPRYWKEKAADFASTAEDVLKQHRDSGRHVPHIAEYLYGGLDLTQRAIEVLLIAQRDGILDTQAQIQLCDYLRDQFRIGEAIPILEPIVEEIPDVMAYRTRLITAYGRTDRKESMRALVDSTDEFFRQKGRWTDANVSGLAHCCFDNKLYAEAVAYYDEAIAIHQRTQPHRGIGNGTLSRYYEGQSRAYVGLGDTVRAVDAASAAVVAWGPNQSQRSSSLHWLVHAIEQSNDLDGFVQHLDRQADETGQDSPLIRQSVGIVFANRNANKKAITQLSLAIDLQPNDPVSHERLIRVYEKTGDRAGVTRQILAQLDFDRHNLELYQKLADQMKEDPTNAERAVTTVVEAAPTEAEHHQALANIRQQQDRWDDAITHWQQVAKLRALEPGGLLKLAEAQLHQRKWDEARETIGKLSQTEWPERFHDVRAKTDALRKRLP